MSDCRHGGRDAYAMPHEPVIHAHEVTFRLSDGTERRRDLYTDSGIGVVGVTVDGTRYMPCEYDAARHDAEWMNLE